MGALRLRDIFGDSVYTLDLDNIKSKVSLVEIVDGQMIAHLPDFRTEDSSPHAIYVNRDTAKQLRPLLQEFVPVNAFKITVPDFAPRDWGRVINRNAPRTLLQPFFEADKVGFTLSAAFINPRFVEGIDDKGNYREIRISHADRVLTTVPSPDLDRLLNRPQAKQKHDPRP